jgi:diguanylate cyclase (GGDEF)-like protein
VGSTGETVRFGGEEILVLMANTGRDAAHAIAERIRTAIESLSILHRGLGDGHVVTASLGVACGRRSEYLLEDLLREADAALYAAKRNGRNTVSMSTGRTGGSFERSGRENGDNVSMSSPGSGFAI